ncbi:MAG: DMT family transporter [Planctomycetota bacterium]
MEGYGIAAALGSCLLWAWSASRFQSSVKRWGPFACNFFKTTAATGLFGLCVLVLWSRGDAGFGSGRDALFLALSGICGMALGDWALFGAMGRIGARQGMLIHGTSPLFLLAWSFVGFGDPLGAYEIGGILLVIAGVSLVTWMQRRGGEIHREDLAAGIVLALLGAIGQAGGILLAKDALPSFHPMTAAGTRLCGALLGLLVIQIVRRRLHPTLAALGEGFAWREMFLPSFVGTFVGIALMLLAIDYTRPAVAGTLLSTTPIFIIPFAVFMLGERFRWGVLAGTAVAVLGIAVIGAS